MSEDILIHVQDLRKSFRVGVQDIEVLKGINFDVKKRDFTVIIGPSGSGKSTLLHSLLGLEVPTSGQVMVLGEDIYLNTTEDERSVFRKKHIGMVYQQPNWIRSMNVVENVSFPLILLGIERVEAVKQAWKSLQSVGMEKWVNYRPSELSGGQQQKIALARALTTDPEIIIADEPTGNLDYESGQNLMQVLDDLNKVGKAVLMVTHDLEYLKYAQVAIRLLDGTVVETINDPQKFDGAGGLRTKRAQ